LIEERRDERFPRDTDGNKATQRFVSTIGGYLSPYFREENSKIVTDIETKSQARAIFVSLHPIVQ
jgi:hypothetical protein